MHVPQLENSGCPPHQVRAARITGTIAYLIQQTADEFGVVAANIKDAWTDEHGQKVADLMDRGIEDFELISSSLGKVIPYSLLEAMLIDRHAYFHRMPVKKIEHEWRVAYGQRARLFAIIGIGGLPSLEKALYPEHAVMQSPVAQFVFTQLGMMEMYFMLVDIHPALLAEFWVERFADNFRVLYEQHRGDPSQIAEELYAHIFSQGGKIVQSDRMLSSKQYPSLKIEGETLEKAEESRNEKLAELFKNEKIRSHQSELLPINVTSFHGDTQQSGSGSSEIKLA